MAVTTQQDDDVIASINITPFVDVVLVLLIIFMVTSTAITRASVEVELPQAAVGGESVETTLNLVMTQDEEVTLNGERATFEEIAAAVRREREASASGKLQAVIAADQRVDYGAVMRLIDVIKQNGVTSFALNIERKTNQGAG